MVCFRSKRRSSAEKGALALAACKTLGIPSKQRPSSILQPESIDSWQQGLRGRFFAVLCTDKHC